MKVKNIYFKNFFLSSKKLKKNLKTNIKKVEITIKNLEKDIKNNRIPLLKVYSKSNSFNFTNVDIKKYQKFIKKNFNYVGDNFAYEARSIHYNKDKKSQRIYGNASSEEISDLRNEGIDTEVIPWFKDNEN